MPATGRSAPAAEVVMVWSPGAPIAPIEAVARRLGAAVIDRSPPPPARAETAQFVQRGVAAYEAIQLDEAQAALDQARDLADRSGADGLTRTQLSDLFLYRGLVRAARGDEAAAWDELVTAMVVHPTRSLDPAQYAPNIQNLVKRAREDVLQKRPQATIAIDAPDGCTTYVDGELVAGPVLRSTGLHLARVACSDREPWATRIDLTTLNSHLIASPRPYQPPSDTDVLVQARSAGIQAIVVVEVRSRLAIVRLVGADGTERERRAITVTKYDLAPVASAIETLLAPRVVVRTAWYESRWAWALGAAVITAAIVVPITASIAGDSGAAHWTLRVRGLP